MTTLAEFVRRRRGSQGLSQAQLAQASGLTQAYVSDIERGKTRMPSVEQRRKLARALGAENLDLLLAAGELEPDDLTRWAKAHGFSSIADDPSSTPLSRAAAELAAEPPESWRVQLALELPKLTQAEARWLLNLVKTMPSEASEQRQELDQGKSSREAFLGWRNARDDRDDERQIEAAL